MELTNLGQQSTPFKYALVLTLLFFAFGILVPNNSEASANGIRNFSGLSVDIETTRQRQTRKTDSGKDTKPKPKSMRAHPNQTKIKKKIEKFKSQLIQKKLT